MDEIRDHVSELRLEVGRLRSVVVRTGDDVEVIRARVDDVLVAVATLSELEDHRREAERLAAAERVEEVRSLAAERAAREAERLEARRWWRVSVLERIALPALSAAAAFALARLDRCTADEVGEVLRSHHSEDLDDGRTDPTTSPPSTGAAPGG